jgi:hypothetical protein
MAKAKRIITLEDGKIKFTVIAYQYGLVIGDKFRKETYHKKDRKDPQGYITSSVPLKTIPPAGP